MKKINDTPEEAKIRKEFAEKGIKGLSPAKVIDIPKAELGPMVLEGLSDIEIGGGYGVSGATIAKLRKFYGLPLKVDVKKMLTCVEKDKEEFPEDDQRYNITELGEEVVKANPALIHEYEGGPIAKVVYPQTEEIYDPPLLDIENQAATITPLLQGIAKYLERLGKEKVQVVVTVRKV